MTTLAPETCPHVDVRPIPGDPDWGRCEACGDSTFPMTARAAGLEPPLPTDLPGIRDRIDEIDAQIAILVAERVELARRAGAAKKAAGLPVRDLLREATVGARFRALAGDNTRPVIRAIIDVCIAAQEDAADG